MEKQKCCCIPDQSKLEEGCSNDAEYEIFSLDNKNTPTLVCAKHLEPMLGGRALVLKLLELWENKCQPPNNTTLIKAYEKARKWNILALKYRFLKKT